MEDSAIAVMSKGQGIVIAEKDRVVFTPEGETQRGKALKVTVKIGGNKESAVMAPGFMNIYEGWKAAPPVAPQS